MRALRDPYRKIPVTRDHSATKSSTGHHGGSILPGLGGQPPRLISSRPLQERLSTHNDVWLGLYLLTREDVCGTVSIVRRRTQIPESRVQEAQASSSRTLCGVDTLSLPKRGKGTAGLGTWQGRSPALCNFLVLFHCNTLKTLS